MELAAFFVQTRPGAATLHLDILDTHLGDGLDAGEDIDHNFDQGAVPEAQR
jgi:hypothetical protein